MKLLAARQVKLGFIGLGNMGSRIAQRLLDHAYELTVFDLDNTKAEALVPSGAVPANDIAELAQSADVGVMQARSASPFLWTVQAPHRAMPQPNLVPVNPKMSRKYQSSGISGSPSKLCGTPLTFS